MAKSELVVLMSVVLTACASAPVGQGGQDELLFAAGDLIRFRWDPQLTSEAKVRDQARAYCGGRDVDEVESPPDASAPAGSRTKTWRCKTFSGTGSGM